jgi:hypothetical protein
LDKVPAQISRWLTDQLYANVMPRLAGNLGAVEHVDFWLVQVEKVACPRVGVVLAWPYLTFVRIELIHGAVLKSGIHFGVVVIPIVNQSVAWRVPATIAQVEAAHEGNGFVDHAKLLVVRPQEVPGLRIRRTLDQNIGMEIVKSILGIKGIDRAVQQ